MKKNDFDQVAFKPRCCSCFVTIDIFAENECFGLYNINFVIFHCRCEILNQSCGLEIGEKSPKCQNEIMKVITETN